MKSKDQILLEEAYLKILNEERPRFTSSGIKVTWNKDSKSGEWDGEFKIAEKTYYVETQYDLDYTEDKGDYDTPPDLTIDRLDLIDPKFYEYSDETGEYIELNLENNPDLYKALSDAVEIKIAEYEYERL